MTKYLNKYRVESHRKKGFDYSSKGGYLITICTQNRTPFFGNIINGEMILSEIGKLAHQFWAEIPQHFPFTFLANFVIMPDHIHGIIFIEKKLEAKIETQKEVFFLKNEKMAAISPKTGTISTIIRSYKSAVTKFSRQNDPNFSWQANYHDAIICDKNSFENMQRYIENNPKNWGKK